MPFPRNYPSSFKEASLWRKSLIEFSEEHFSHLPKRVAVKEEENEFKIVLFSSSEPLRRAVLDLYLPVKIEFKPWYGEGDRI